MKITIKMLIISFIVILFFSCKNEKSRIINEELNSEILGFIEDAKTHSIKYDDNRNVLIYFTKINSYYKVNFYYDDPISFENIYAVVNLGNYNIYFYADSDISAYVFANQPFEVDSSKIKLKKVKAGYIYDPYNDMMFFNGITFSRDTVW